MADFYNIDTFAQTTIGTLTASSLGTALSAPSTNHVLASTYTVISSSLPEDADGLIFTVATAGGSGTTRCLVNLYVGAAGQEQLLLSGIQCGRGSSTGGMQKHIYAPVSIPKGTRVTARHQCDVAASTPTIYVSVTPLSGGFSSAPCASVSESWGALSASSRGTLVTAAASTNTLGTKTELIASTGIDARHVVIQSHQNNAANYLLTLYVGASGSEVAIFGPVQVAGHSDSAGAVDLSMEYGAVFSLPLSVPAGSRISAAIQSTTASATADVSVIAFG